MQKKNQWQVLGTQRTARIPCILSRWHHCSPAAIVMLIAMRSQPDGQHRKVTATCLSNLPPENPIEGFLAILELHGESKLLCVFRCVATVFVQREIEYHATHPMRLLPKFDLHSASYR